MVRVQEVRAGTVTFGTGHPLGFILGPCVIESEAFLREIGPAIKEIATTVDVDFVFKASYDKANRSSITSFRGTGCLEGCRLLSEVGAELGVPVTTDVHTAEEVQIAAEFIDVLQIPAFLCRQTDLIEAAAKSGRVVNVKKGQFLAPWDVSNIADKLKTFGCENYFFTERGTSFGYNNLVADMRSIPWKTACEWSSMQPTRCSALVAKARRAAATVASPRCWQERRWPLVVTGSSWKPTPTRPKRSVMARIRFPSINWAQFSRPCAISTLSSGDPVHDFSPPPLPGNGRAPESISPAASDDAAVAGSCDRR